MKTVLIGLIFLGFTGLMHAQHDLAYVKVNMEEPLKPTKDVLINDNYFTTFADEINSERIRKFQKLVANYDIKSASIYSNDENYHYTIVFEEGQNKIEAIFNQDGKIMQCMEHFADIRLPQSITNKIAKNYPGWAFSEISCKINYNLDKEQQVVYTVSILKGDEKKILKLNTADYKL